MSEPTFMMMTILPVIIKILHLKNTNVLLVVVLLKRSEVILLCRLRPQAIMNVTTVNISVCASGGESTDCRSMRSIQGLQDFATDSETTSPAWLK